jgi:pSer/pThr/pTyr-binding forkhead associated (FHA) protein
LGLQWSMRLEVQIGESEPVIYLIDNQDVYLGSKDTNDIVIKSSEISSKHLKISFQESLWFLTDMGSTNGTFVNEERLIPGRRVEFPPNETVTLANQVSLRMLTKVSTEKNKDVTLKPPSSQAETSVPEPRPATVKKPTLSSSDKTRVISLKEMQKAQKVRDAKKKQKILEKKREESKRMRAEKSALKRVTIIASAWLIAGVILQMGWQHIPGMMKKAYGPPKAGVDRVLMDGSTDDQQEAFAIDPEKLNVRSELLAALIKPKCTNSKENVFCSKLKEFQRGNSGVVELNTDMAFYVEERPWLEKARKFLVDHHSNQDLPVEERITDEDATRKLAIILLMRESLGKTTPIDFRPRIFYLVLYSLDADIAYASAFKSDLLPLFTIKYEGEKLKLTESNGKLFQENLAGFINVVN